MQLRKITAMVIAMAPLLGSCNRPNTLTSPVPVVAALKTNAQIPLTSTNREVPMNLIQQIPTHLKDLKLGMSPEEAFRTLGIWGYQPFASVDGPQTRYRHNYHLNQGYILLLVFDETTQPHSLVEFELMDEGWKNMKP